MTSKIFHHMLSAEGVVAGFDDRNVLNGIDLKVGRGEIYALLGSNGAGKSTILNVFLGLHRPRAGSAHVAGIDVVLQPALAREKLAYLPESVALYEHLTAIEYLQYMLSLAGAKVDASTIHTALDRVGLPTASRAARTSSYSKGMRQKVAIALAIARNAPVLLMDEPASGLDPLATAELNRLLSSLRDDGAAILLVTHDLPSAAEFADRVGLLRSGCIAEEIGGASEHFSLPQLVERYGAASL